MALYHKENEVKGQWVKKEELRNGLKATITTETNPVPSTFTDKDGKEKTQDVCKVKFEGMVEEVNVSLNRATIQALVQAYGEDSKEWIGKPLTVEVEKMRVAGKAVTALYLIPEGFYKFDDADGFARIGKNTEGADEQFDEDLPF